MKSIKIIKPKFLNLDLACRQEVLDFITHSNLEDNCKNIIKECLTFNCELEKHIKNKTIKFKQINELFNSKTQEASRKSIEPDIKIPPGSDSNNTENNHKKQKKEKVKKPRSNGGRYGYDDYPNSKTVIHEVEEVQPGDLCIKCHKGKYYYSEEKKQLEFVGGPILEVIRHLKRTLKCNCCGHTLSSNKKIDKWTIEAKSTICILKLYGMPLYRIAKLQELFGIPIAPSTIWDKYKEIHEDCAKYIVKELLTMAPEGRLLSTDDTGIKILSKMEDNKFLPEKQQRACHTTVMCIEHTAGKIILYVSADRYCKENWKPLLNKRQAEEKLIIVTDASSQSYPTGEELNKSISAGCLGNHGRRKFADIKENHPEECGYFLNLISEIYDNESECKNQAPEKRLEFHQKNSKHKIEAIYSKITELFSNKIVEPNSDLGKAMQYWLNHQQRLTEFLRTPGCPLDNNWSEFNLRIIALYRKTSMFFLNLNSAEVNSNMFSLIATCEANNINSFEYLNWIQHNWQDVRENPAKYLPWHFKIHTERIAC